MKKLVLTLMTAVALLVGVQVMTPVTVAEAADKKTEVNTKIDLDIKAKGVYSNWDGVSNVAQFVDAKGNVCLAYDNGDYVTVLCTNEDGSLKSKKLKLKKRHPLFGNVICDADGNYYVVTGEENTGDDATKKTVFVSKYDKDGKHIKTVGDNGSSSLAYYFSEGYRTKIPFEAGNCDVAVNGDLLSVNYAREMYSGHQSNSVFTINIKTMKTVDSGVIYESHSFAQRVVPFGKGFVYASEGDCFERAFTINTDCIYNKGYQKPVFHFWVSKGAYDRYDMYEINNNFAHMGGLANVKDKAVALVGTSVKSLDENAKIEKEQLFIQIFDPNNATTDASSYRTKGTRTGMSGSNGNYAVTDYGVKWLTNFDSKYSIRNPQVVAIDDDPKGKLVVFYEKYEGSKFLGTYYIQVSATGKILKKSTLYSKEAHLNPCTMPVYANGKISWAGNKERKSYDEKRYVYLFGLELE